MVKHLTVVVLLNGTITTIAILLFFLVDISSELLHFHIINLHDLFADLVSTNNHEKENQLAVLHFYLSSISQQ